MCPAILILCQNRDIEGTGHRAAYAPAWRALCQGSPDGRACSSPAPTPPMISAPAPVPPVVRPLPRTPARRNPASHGRSGPRFRRLNWRRSPRPGHRACPHGLRSSWRRRRRWCKASVRRRFRCGYRPHPPAPGRVRHGRAQRVARRARSGDCAKNASEHVLNTPIYCSCSNAGSERQARPSSRADPPLPRPPARIGAGQAGSLSRLPFPRRSAPRPQRPARHHPCLLHPSRQSSPRARASRRPPIRSAHRLRW